MSLVKLIHILGIWRLGFGMLVAGVADKKRKCCIICNPGRSVKFEALRGRFWIDWLRFVLFLISISGEEAGIAGSQRGAASRTRACVFHNEFLFLFLFCLTKGSLQIFANLCFTVLNWWPRRGLKRVLNRLYWLHRSKAGEPRGRTQARTDLTTVNELVQIFF